MNFSLANSCGRLPRGVKAARGSAQLFAVWSAPAGPSNPLRFTEEALGHAGRGLYCASRAAGGDGVAWPAGRSEAPRVT